MTRRLAALLAVLAVVAGVFVARLPKHADRSIVGLRGHSAPVSALTGPSPWPEAMHDAAHTGTSSVQGPQTGHVRWTRNLGQNTTPGPVVEADGDIVIGTDHGALHALDPRTGKDVWTFDDHTTDVTDLTVSPAILPGGVIAWPAPGRDLVGISPAGRLLWRLPLHGSPTSPAITPGGLVVGDTDGWVYSVAVPASGTPTVAWSLELGEPSYGSVAVSDGHVYQTVDDAVVQLTTAGRLVWRHSLPSPVEVSPAATPDGGVVVGAGGDKEYGLDSTGRLRWTHDRRAQTYSSPVVTPDGLAVFGDHVGVVTVVDATTGKLAARYAGLGHRQYPRTIGIWSPPVIDSSHDVYWASYQGHVMGFAADGRRLLDIDTGTAIDSAPALTGDGGLVVADTAGVVRLID